MGKVCLWDTQMMESDKMNASGAKAQRKRDREGVEIGLPCRKIED